MKTDLVSAETTDADVKTEMCLSDAVRIRLKALDLAITAAGYANMPEDAANTTARAALYEDFLRGDRS